MVLLHEFITRVWFSFSKYIERAIFVLFFIAVVRQVVSVCVHLNSMCDISQFCGCLMFYMMMKDFIFFVLQCVTSSRFKPMHSFCAMNTHSQVGIKPKMCFHILVWTCLQPFLTCLI